MQAIYSFLGKLNHPLLIFTILGVRAGLFGSSIGDALFLIGYLSYVGYNNYLESQRKNDINAEIKAEIGELRNIISAVGLKNNVRPNEIPTGKRFF